MEGEADRVSREALRSIEGVGLAKTTQIMAAKPIASSAVSRGMAFVAPHHFLFPQALLSPRLEGYMRITAMLLTGILLVACASSGVLVNPAQLKAFKKGETTVAEVIAKLGKPTTMITQMDGTTTIQYIHTITETKPESLIPYIGPFFGGAHTIHTKMTTLVFDKDGKLADYSTSQSVTGARPGFPAGSENQKKTDQPPAAGE